MGLSQEEQWARIERRSEEARRNVFTSPRLKAARPTKEMMEQYHYDKVTEILFTLLEDDYKYRVEDFREKVKQMRVSKRKVFRELLEYTFNNDNWKIPSNKPRRTDITFNANKYRQCSVCGRVFYDKSRNGRRTVCHYGIKKRYDDGSYQSTCENTRNNAKSRKSSKGHTNHKYDGSFSRLSEKTRENKEKELFVPFSQVTDSKKEEKLLSLIESQAKPTSYYRDPQDVVCDTPTTHKLFKPSKTAHSWYPSKSRIREIENDVVEWSNQVSIKTGDKKVINREQHFENNLLPIKEKLPKEPKNL